MSKRSKQGRRLRYEGLEAREMMAGNVSAWVDDGLLVVYGDNADNVVEIKRGNSDSQFVVDGQKRMSSADTRINGGYAAQTFNGVTRGVQVLLNGGDDWLKIGRRSGAPTAIHGSFGLGIDLGSGNDTAYIDRVHTDVACGISGQSGNDWVEVYGSYFGLDLIVDTAGGNDNVLVKRSTAARYMMTGTGSGHDRVTLDRSGAAWIYGELGSGNDTLSVRYCQSALQPGFDGGSGNDRVAGMHYNIFPVPANCIKFERWG